MAKDIAISKISKISKAQQNMLLSVLIASVFLGAGVSLTIRFVKQITFNAKVIAAEEESAATYTKAIKETGICKKPSGNIYSDDELKRCDPDNVSMNDIQGSLRYNVLQDLAANKALNSVPKEESSVCRDSKGKNYTFKQLNDAYNNATSNEERQAAIQNIKTCSALRIVPDALPAFKNEEALLASLNQIFIISDYTPTKSFSPSKNSSSNTSLPAGLNPIELNLSIEADAATTMTVLSNIERSIRDFDISRATIEWSGSGSLTLDARATAFYAEESTLTESSKSITPGG